MQAVREARIPQLTASVSAIDVTRYSLSTRTRGDPLKHGSEAACAELRLLI
jgi:hypothetical protein